MVGTKTQEKESCLLWPGRTKLIHKSFDSPASIAHADACRQTFRRVRDGISSRIRQFLATSTGRSLSPPPPRSLTQAW